jgi:hypothetical protein
MPRFAFVLLALALGLALVVVSVAGRGNGWAVPAIAVGPPSPEPPNFPDTPGTPTMPVYRTPVPPATSPAVAQPRIAITRATILHSVSGRMRPTRTLVLGEKARFVLAWRATSPLSAAPSAHLVIRKGASALYRRTLRGQSGAIAGTAQADLRIRSSAAVGLLMADFQVTGPASAHRSLPFIVARHTTARR